MTELQGADAERVLRWVYQAGPEIIPSNIHDLAARALGEPSMAHGHARDDRTDAANPRSSPQTPPEGSSPIDATPQSIQESVTPSK